MKYLKKWLFWIIIIIIIILLILLIAFFYPKRCGGLLISKILPIGYEGPVPHTECNCLGIKGDIQSVPIICYGICSKNTCKDNMEGIEEIGKKECANWYKDIDNALNNANYCKIDEDCKTVPLGGKYIEFGCYHYVNKEINENEFLERMLNYIDGCTNIINKCAKTPKAKCVNEKCVSIE